MDTYQAVDAAARESYGRLVAYLASRSGDVASAEDALSDAFVAALESWPRSGVPAKPEAWLLTAARRRLIDRARHAVVEENALPELAEQAAIVAEDEMEFPDERLKLLFVCAHPAIDASMRTPLMLQTVMGLDAARIASAFLVQPATMGQRLSRAKTKIRVARIPFLVPEPADLPLRLHAVLEAIYAAYGSAWEDVTGADPRRAGLAAKALELAELLLRLLPGEPEVHGLLALMLHCEARRAARRGLEAEYVPLSEQDTGLWSRDLMGAAEDHLRAASRAGRIGQFQLEAAIQSVHNGRASSGKTDWESIALFYEGLVLLAPTTGALIGRAAALAEARGADAGWAALEGVPMESVRSYQPYWALKAHLLGKLGRGEESREAYEMAIGLCEDGVLREYLSQQMKTFDT